MRNRLTLAALAVLGATALACGGGNTVSPGDESKLGAPAGADDATNSTAVLTRNVGEPVEVTSATTDVSYTVTKTQTRAGSQFNKPNNGVWLLAYLEVQVSRGSSYVCSCEFSFIGVDGTVYESTAGLFDDRKEFVSADIAAGQKSAGWLFFDVPKEPEGKVQLKVPDLLGGDKYAYWTL